MDNHPSSERIKACSYLVLQPHHLPQTGYHTMAWRGLEEDCGLRDGWGSATIRAVGDASCSGEELRAGTEAANSAWVQATGVEAEGFGYKWR